MTTQDAYARAGVDYNALDRVKRLGQAAARKTEVSERLARLGIRFAEESRGESAILFEFPEFYLAHVQEGLGTKNRVADSYVLMAAGKGVHIESGYAALAQCNTAMIVNDLITCGSDPLSLGVEWAAGGTEWFENERRVEDLVSGTHAAAVLSDCVWGPGETPVLKGVIEKDSVSLSGSGIGVIWPKSNRITGAAIEEGDLIVGFSSSGVHANGLTLCRKVAGELPGGYLTQLPSGMTYGEALLQPTVIYHPFMRAFRDAGVNIHYAVNITGHGFRKLMRAKTKTPFGYEVDFLPEAPEVFEFIQKKGGLSDEDMFGNFNMGIGFAIMISENDMRKVSDIAASLRRDAEELKDVRAYFIGRVRASEKKYVKAGLKAYFPEETLDI